MKFEHKEISIREIVNNYVNNDEEGVVGYDGKLNIRPKYQREFIYKDKQRNAVMDTIMKSYPLGDMYWAKNGESYELMDGQQRTVSFCEFVAGNYSIDIGGNKLFWHNMTDDQKDKILDYKIFVNVCEGNESEKLEWFKTINIAGEKLTDQELRNAVYAGPWLTDAKRHFSKTGCPAYQIGKDYLSGTPIRQDYLETAIDWISGGDIEGYMATHQNDPNANALWFHFRAVIDWVSCTFPTYRREMKGLKWGELYDKNKSRLLDSKQLEKELSQLIEDEEVQNVKGIYPYVLTREEKYLNIREFSDKDKRIMFEKQQGVCPVCGKTFKIDEMEADHIIPWADGGKTVLANGQMLCKMDNRTKSGK